MPHTMLPIVVVVIFLHVDFLLGEVSSRHFPITLLGSFARNLLKLRGSLKAQTSGLQDTGLAPMAQHCDFRFSSGVASLRVLAGHRDSPEALPTPAQDRGGGALCKWCFHYRFIFETLDKTGLVWFD